MSTRSRCYRCGRVSAKLYVSTTKHPICRRCIRPDQPIAPWKHGAPALLRDREVAGAPWDRNWPRPSVSFFYVALEELFQARSLGKDDGAVIGKLQSIWSRLPMSEQEELDHALHWRWAMRAPSNRVGNQAMRIVLLMRQLGPSTASMIYGSMGLSPRDISGTLQAMVNRSVLRRVFQHPLLEQRVCPHCRSRLRPDRCVYLLASMKHERARVA